MNTSRLRLMLLALTIAMAGTLLSGCVTAGYGYGGGYVANYYEPYGETYGGWGPGYEVGPYWGGGGRRGSYPGGHHYRPAPASRPMPSIPSGRGGHSGRGDR